MSETSAAPLSTDALEQRVASERAADELRPRVVVSAVLAGLAGWLMLLTVGGYLVIVALLFVAGAGGGAAGVRSDFGALMALTAAEAVVLAPCLWLRRRHQRLAAHLAELRRESAGS